MLQEMEAVTQNQLVQRLDRLESSVALIEDAVLKAQEEGSTRHEEMVSHLSQLKEDIMNNHRILKKLRDRGCFSCLQRKECIFFIILLVLVFWLYFLHNYTQV
jgi:Mg2+ and Co2+ transporter CorA